MNTYRSDFYCKNPYKVGVRSNGIRLPFLAKRYSTTHFHRDSRTPLPLKYRWMNKFHLFNVALIFLKSGLTVKITYTHQQNTTTSNASFIMHFNELKCKFPVILPHSVVRYRIYIQIDSTMSIIISKT